MKISMISLGCDKNTVDAEFMLGIVSQYGFSYTEDENDADAIIVNTCCFIEDAKKESIETILEMASLKKTAKLKALIVTGCMAQRYKDEILKEIPEVDALLGTSSYDKIVEVINRAINGEKNMEFLDLDRLPDINTRKIRLAGAWYSYLKIAEGCNKNCTYCIIPKLRGSYRSYPIESLVKQAKDLANLGVKELILVAQETTLYGVDLYSKKALPLLLGELAKVEGIEWIRLLYCYPEEITDELIEVIAKEDKIVKYMDVPIQHASNKILQKMARKTKKEEIKERIGKLREKVEGISLRTTFIVGFPGESEEDFEELKDFVKEMKFDKVGVFTYSKEEGTTAYKFKEQINKRTKEKRKKELMLLQQDISRENLKKYQGKRLKVIVEGKLSEEDIYIGRTYMDAPNVDSYVFFSSKYEHISGDFVDVLITNSSEYDLEGEVYEYSE